MSALGTEQIQDALGLASDVPLERDDAGYTFPGLYATMTTAYMARYGATREHLMHVAIKNHQNGGLNPKAQFVIAPFPELPKEEFCHHQCGLPEQYMMKML